jgi:hypothetical protein
MEKKNGILPCGLELQNLEIGQQWWTNLAREKADGFWGRNAKEDGWSQAFYTPLLFATFYFNLSRLFGSFLYKILGTYSVLTLNN